MFPGSPNVKLFINYRREDTAPYAGRLYDRLTAHFGADQVFIDIDQIEPGEDFVEAINSKVGACDIAIVLIGPNWLGATDASGKHRLDDNEDFVRMEIIAALERKIRVIPVLVGGTRMPRKQDLPEALAPLSRRNAIELSETRFHADVDRLIEAIEKPRTLPEKKVEPVVGPVAFVAEPRSISQRKSKDLRNVSESSGTADFWARLQPNDPQNVANARTFHGQIALRYKVAFYVAAWILALLVTYSLQLGGNIWLVSFPAGLLALFRPAYPSPTTVGFCLAFYLIHAVIYFRSRSRRPILILFSVLLAALACTVVGWYRYYHFM
jgi:hypothetical protein